MSGWDSKLNVSRETWFLASAESGWWYGHIKLKYEFQLLHPRTPTQPGFYSKTGLGFQTTLFYMLPWRTLSRLSFSQYGAQVRSASFHLDRPLRRFSVWRILCQRTRRFKMRPIEVSYCECGTPSVWCHTLGWQKFSDPFVFFTLCTDNAHWAPEHS